MKHILTRALLFSAFTVRALACASCGSGGDDPLILYPNEEWKGYVGFGSTGNYKLVDHQGNLTEEPGPERKLTTTLSLGRKVSLRSFATITLPVVSNHLGEESKQGLGDPLLSARYTIYALNVVEEYLPQVQFLAGYRHSMARGINDTENENLLDVFGTGYSQIRAGLDIWSGLTPVQYGFAVVHGRGLAKQRGDSWLEPGKEWRATVSAGQTFAIVKYVLGLSRTWIGKAKSDYAFVEGSAQVNNSVFATFDIFVHDGATVRTTVARQAAFGHNLNTTRSDSMSLAYMRAL